MVKKKIIVNGEKELIEKLNSKIKTIKSEGKVETVATPDIKEPVEEKIDDDSYTAANRLVDKQTKTDDPIYSGTIVDEKYNFNDPNNLGDADAYTKPLEESDEKDIKRLIDKFGPDIANLLDRIDHIEHVNHIDDNASCRQTIEKECGNPIFDESSNIINDKPVSNELKRILNTSKQLSEKIKDIKNSSIKKTMSNDVEYVINDILSPKKDLTLITDEYEMVNHPQHYNNYEYEVIDMMRKIYGDEKTAIFCELNAFKYRMRMGTKPTSPIDEDLKKEQWYLKKKKEILNNKIIIKTDKGTL